MGKCEERVGIIGGTGMEGLAREQEPVRVGTPFGEVGVRLGELGGTPAAVVLRHGEGHGVLPHEVNYRANMWALRECGARQVLATVACGSLSPTLGAGDLAVLTDFLDLTRGRADTCRGAAGLPPDAGFYHVDLQPPYCPHLSALLAGVDVVEGEPLPGAVYACVNGPRFESPAEIRMLAQLGAMVVGMTGLPEAALARELGLCYASVAIVTNAAAGLSDAPLEHSDVQRQAERALARVLRIVELAARAARRARRDCCPAARRRAQWFGE